jgi:hypothetical protein
MGFYITAEQGDDLPKIADENGFRDYNTIWQAPENAELRQQRQPTVLMPGDRVWVPDKRPGEVSAPAGAKQRFRLEVAVAELRVALTGFDGKPMADVACTLTLGSGAPRAVTSDGNGVVSCPLPPGTDSATLGVGGRELALEIGHLDPVDQRSGLIERLRNLGYLEPLAADETDNLVSDDELAFAVSCFQRAAGLPVDGDAAAIVGKLKEVHGC